MKVHLPLNLSASLISHRGVKLSGADSEKIGPESFERHLAPILRKFGVHQPKDNGYWVVVEFDTETQTMTFALNPKSTVRRTGPIPFKDKP